MTAYDLVPIRLDCPTGQLHGMLISASTRLVYEFLCRKYSNIPLRDVATVSSGGTPSKSNGSYWGGRIPWAAPRDLKTFQLAETTHGLNNAAIEDGAAELHQPPATLLVTRGMILSRYVPVSHASRPFTSNQDIRIVKPIAGAVDGSFLSAMLLGAERVLYRLVTDSTAGQRRIETPRLLKVLIPNIPLVDQKAVGEFVRSLAQGHDGFRQAIQAVPRILAPLGETLRRVDALVDRITTAQQSTADIEKRSQNLLNGTFHDLTNDAPHRRLGDVAPLTRRPAIVDPMATYPGVSVRSFGRGTFHNPPQHGSDITWEKPHLVNAGDILISNIKAWEGAIAVAKPEDDGRYGSHRYLTYVPVPSIATARFVCFYLLSPEGLHQVGEASPGSADRNRTTNAKALEEIPVPLPSFDRQVWFGELYDKVEAIRHLQSETKAERDALVPAILDRAFKGEL